MSVTPDPVELFSDRNQNYVRFIRAVGYPRGLRGYFLRSPLLRPELRVLDAGCGTGVVTLAQADVLDLGAPPAGWSNYDLVVSSAMLEYLPRDRLPAALAGLRRLLGDVGTFVLFITRRNWLTRPLIGRWWQSNLYDTAELRHAFEAAGFSSVRFNHFAGAFRYLDVWGYVIEACG